MKRTFHQPSLQGDSGGRLSYFAGTPDRTDPTDLTDLTDLTDPTVRPYSARNASSGSARVARQAGIRQAAALTASSSRPVRKYTTGSSGDTS